MHYLVSIRKIRQCQAVLASFKQMVCFINRFNRLSDGLFHVRRNYLCTFSINCTQIHWIFDCNLNIRSHFYPTNSRSFSNEVFFTSFFFFKKTVLIFQSENSSWWHGATTSPIAQYLHDFDVGKRTRVIYTDCVMDIVSAEGISNLKKKKTPYTPWERVAEERVHKEGLNI